MNRMNMKPSEETTLDIPTYEEICESSKKSISDTSNDSDGIPQRNRRQKLSFGKKKEQDLSDVKIKTLAEIRAEKKLKAEKMQTTSCDNADSEISSTNSEVTSTSKTEEMSVDDVNENASQDRGAKRKSDGVEEKIIKKKPKLRRPQIVDSDSTVSSVGESVKNEKSEKSTENSVKRRESRSDASKLDEMLLLDEDDFECSNVSLQAEEDLLKDIDELLSD